MSSPIYELRLGTTDTSKLVELCENSCIHAMDGACDDGGPGADYAVCNLEGSDCDDCGPRSRGGSSLSGFACPVGKMAPSPPALIDLDIGDGFAPGYTYAPAVLLSTAVFATVTTHVTMSDMYMATVSR